MKAPAPAVAADVHLRIAATVIKVNKLSLYTFIKSNQKILRSLSRPEDFLLYEYKKVE